MFMVVSNMIMVKVEDQYLTNSIGDAYYVTSTKT